MDTSRTATTVCLALALAACGDGAPPPAPPADGGVPAATAARGATVPPVAPATPGEAIVQVPGGDGDATPPVPDRPSRTTARSSAAATHTLPHVPIQRALRVGAQPGADRLVFEFDGDGLPAWSVEYVDRPVYECGSGDVVRLPGDAWLQVRFTGAQAHTVAGEGTTGAKLRTVDMTNLLALARICDFEGEVTWVAAVRHPGGYTPRALASPARLVVDVAH